MITSTSSSPAALFVSQDSPESNDQPLHLFDYYHQAIFAYIGETYSGRIAQSLHRKPAEVRHNSFLERLPGDQVLLSGEPSLSPIPRWSLRRT
jgi:hypothetical protein